MRTIFQRCAQEAGISLNVPIEVDSLAGMKDLVRGGYGATLLPLAPIHEDVAAGRLTAAALTDPLPTRRMALSFPGDRPTTRAARLAADAITAIVADMVQRRVWSGELL